MPLRARGSPAIAAMTTRGAGIVLFSSESEALEQNDCWGNGHHGIVLQRDPKSADAPARARITGNRCHDNTQSGILLFSSESEALEQNDCWGNGCHGIGLGRDPNSADAPACARITGNRCHDNTQSGIVLFSSESEALEQNDCWGNGYHGIVLQRDPKSADAPARARITGNRCHDNTGDGIVLFSSESEALEQNDCWGNGYHGIVLERDPKSADAPACARITGNRCHDNTQSGILLFSSESEALEQNDCWGNGYHGIVLQRDPDSADAPARARITGNRCHDNTRAGFVFDDAAPYDLAGDNYAFRNKLDPVTAAPDGRALSNISDLFLGPDETPSETRIRYRKGSRHGALAAQLEQISDGLDVDAFARFLHGHGALHDLKRALKIKKGDGRVPEDKTQVEGAVYSLEPGDEQGDSGGSTYLFRQSGAGGVRKLIWDRVAQHVIRNRPSVTLIGAFGETAAELDTVLSEAHKVNYFDVDALEPGQAPPTGRPDLLRGFQLGSIRLLPPIAVDCAKRSYLALTNQEPTSGFLEPDSPTGLRGWCARLWFLLTTPKYLLNFVGCFLALCFIALMVGVWKSDPGPGANVITLVLAAIEANVDDIQLLDVVQLVVAFFVGAFFLKITVLVNRFLPYHLQIRPKNSRRATDAANPARGKPWKRWISRRILRRNSVSLVVLRNIMEWPEDDMAALAEVVGKRSENSSLILVLECPTRSALDRVLLRPVMDNGGKRVEKLQGVDIMACLGEEPGFLEASPLIENQQRLLGIKGDRADARLEQIRSDILNRKGMPGDILPMICLGSSHYFPFSLQQHSTTATTKLNEEMKETLSQFMSLIGEAGSGEAGWLEDSSSLQNWIDEAREATCARVFLERKDRVEAYRVFGRFQQRNQMSALVADVFGQEHVDDLEDYIQGVLSCGELHAVKAASEALQLKGGAIQHPNRAVAALKGALFLRSERKTRLGGKKDQRRENILTTAWKNVCRALDQFPQPQTETEEIFQAQLYSLSLHVRDPMPDVLMLSKDSRGAAASFLSQLSLANSRFSLLDRRMALERASLDLRPLLALSPKSVINSVEEWLGKAWCRARTLADIMESAETLEDLLRYCQDHKSWPGEIFATALSNAVRHADTDENRRALFQVLDKDIKYFDSLTPEDRPRSFNRPNAPKLQLYLSLFESPEFKQVVFKRRSATGAFSMIELMYGSIGQIFRSEKSTDRIEFWEETSNSLIVKDSGLSV